ncbi:hypothetical protein J7L68_00165, partial [bacterium]|nr:hypothetical protein [bacterium]
MQAFACFLCATSLIAKQSFLVAPDYSNNISTNQEEPQVPSSVPTSRDTFSQQVGEGTDAEHFLKVLLP